MTPDEGPFVRWRSYVRHYVVATGVVGGLLVPAIACARLGETIQACDRRYGTPTTTEASDLAANALEATYATLGFTIRVSFIDGRAERIFYAHPTALTDKEIAKLLKNNGQGETWKATPSGRSGIYRKWETATGATAEYFKPKPWEPLAAFQYCLEIRSSKLVHLIEQRAAEKKRQAAQQAEAVRRRLEAVKRKTEGAKQEEQRQRLRSLDDL